MDLSHTSRRDFLKASGALVVSVMIPGTVPIARAQTSGVGDGKPPLLPDELDSWIAILPDGNVTAFFGKMDMGQGVDVAIGQIVAEELDVRFERVNVVMGDTAFTCNQGGASGSTGIQNGALTLRYAAAEARRLLLERAVEKLGAPAEKLAVKEGVVSVIGESQRTTTYGELIGGQHFHHKLEWNKRYGNPLLAKGQATPKKPAEYKIVGRSIPKEIVAVVAEHEWDAVRAARALKVTWAPPCAPFPEMASLYDHIRQAKATGAQVPIKKGDVDDALKTASRVVEAEYEWPFQSHASMGPACAVADVRADRATLWTGTQKPHFARGFTRQDVATNEGDPKDTLAGQLTGVPPRPTVIFQVPAESYEFPNKRCGWECIPPLLDRGSPLRTGHLRDPLGPETHFASESFIDEIAHAAGVDPVAFRLKYVKDPRHVAVIKAAADRAGWSKRTYPSLRRGKGPVMIGRGFSYTERNGTIVAVVAEVEVNRSSGRVWARQLTVAHDCGLIINPRGLRLTIEGNVVQALARTLLEEVQFDRDQVLSVDWASYPILEIQDAPERVDIVLLDHPTMPASGAGEPSTRTVPAAVANAFFDATGVRMRRVPLTPERVKAALAAAETNR